MDVESCDTCGELVGEGRPDPDWETHNRLHYVEHVFISHDLSDALRIIQQNLTGVELDLAAFRNRSTNI